jgi:uroporphyrinogen-III decarboxylase
VDVMEYGSTEDVKNEVFQILRETDAVNKGGIFIDTSSEINPPIPPENFIAMVEAVNEKRNSKF